MSSIGKLVKLTVWGESHGSMIGGVIDGVDPGIKIDYEKLRAHMKRRSPGKSNTTLRKESQIIIQKIIQIYIIRQGHRMQTILQLLDTMVSTISTEADIFLED